MDAASFRQLGDTWQERAALWQRSVTEVNRGDFADQLLSRVHVDADWCVAHNEAWVSVGVDHDTAAFAVESTRRWWWSMGYPVYPKATRLLITGDTGGSNGYRLRLWKLELHLK